MDEDNRMVKRNSSMQRNWSEMEHNMLVKIFSAFHLLDLVLNFSRVCRSWYSACCDERIWKAGTLDLSAMGRYVSIPRTDKGWDEEEHNSQTYWHTLCQAFDLSGGTITKLIFHFRVYITDDHLFLVARRCRKLQKLVLPRWHGLSLETLNRCLYLWGSTLETLMIPDICFPDMLLVRIIGTHCPNLKELKFMARTLDKPLATSIVKFMPQLKVLSIRDTFIHKKALEFLMNGMENLEILNITHCEVLSFYQSDTYAYLCSEVDGILKRGTRRPKQFLCCPDIACSCRITDYEEKLMTRAYPVSCREDEWRMDQISSLSY